MYPSQPLPRSSTGEMVGLVLLISGAASIVGIGFAVSWPVLQLMVWSLGGAALVGLVVVLAYLLWRDYQAIRLEIEKERSRIRPPVDPAPIVVQPPEPQDGGETPTEAFLTAAWDYWSEHGTLPDVRNQVFAGISKTRAGRMYKRLMTWGAIEGRQEGGGAGKPAAGWTTPGTVKHRMYQERPDWLPVVRQ